MTDISNEVASVSVSSASCIFRLVKRAFIRAKECWKRRQFERLFFSDDKTLFASVNKSGKLDNIFNCTKIFVCNWDCSVVNVSICQGLGGLKKMDCTNATVTGDFPHRQ